MNIREYTHAGPLVLSEPPGDGTYSACLSHTGDNFKVRWLRPEDSPAFINPVTGEICYWMLVMVRRGKDYTRNLAHEKVKLVFDDRLVNASGELSHKQWAWEDWIPLLP